jgi:1-deoxy-D-xylulose-5-phosphate synthase
MEHPILSNLQSPLELHEMSVAELNETATEICDVMCDLLSERSAHFASNLGVVELCLALHSIFDFSQDRLIWDTGHQIYPHKLITGRYHQFKSIRTKQGLMGYPNPAESEYDLFMTGHAGASVSTAQGLHSGDVLAGRADRKAVAVIGDGAFPSGVVYEAMNNAEGNLLVVLNDNEMSICPRVGGVASYLDRLRNSIYPSLKSGIQKVLGKVPLVGDPAERFLAQMKEAVKAGFHGGMLFEELGFQYLGPIDGHDIGLMRKYLQMVSEIHEPVLLHVVTQKGHGFQPAEEDPRTFHAPPVFERVEGKAVFQERSSSTGLLNYTNHARDAIEQQMTQRDDVTCMTAAMCQGNKLEPVRDRFPERFFDVGICEGHAVAFAGGQCKAGARPIVAIYSTFLQRSYDHIFQEVCLQDLPVTFMLDRAGLAGPDGPTHHGVFDLGYLRVFPNISIMAPADQHDMRLMLEFALNHDSATAIRYPKGVSPEIAREPAAVEYGKSEVLSTGKDGTILALGAMVEPSLKAAEKLQADGLDVGVVNARFVKPLDEHVMTDVLRNSPFVVTVEEAALIGGFGSAVLEFAAERRLNTSHVCRLGIPDIFVEHGERSELLCDLGLDADGVYRACKDMAQDTADMETV